MGPTRFVRLRIDCVLEYEHDNVTLPRISGEDLLDALARVMRKMNRERPKLQPKVHQILPGAKFDIRLYQPRRKKSDARTEG